MRNVYRRSGPNPSNPFVDEKGIEHLPGVIEYPWGTISVPSRTKEHEAGAHDETRRLLDSFKKTGKRKW